MASIVFENARVLDGRSDEGETDRHVRVDGHLIAEVSDKPIKDGGARRIDLRGKTSDARVDRLPRPRQLA